MCRDGNSFCSHHEANLDENLQWINQSNSGSRDGRTDGTSAGEKA
jgi:hypothetical protein